MKCASNSSDLHNAMNKKSANLPLEYFANITLIYCIITAICLFLFGLTIACEVLRLCLTDTVITGLFLIIRIIQSGVASLLERRNVYNQYYKKVLCYPSMIIYFTNVYIGSEKFFCFDLNRK